MVPVRAGESRRRYYLDAFPEKFHPRYDAGYRPSANFLNWVTQKYDKDIVKQLNAAIREGKYSADLWKEQTAHTVEDLAGEWEKEVKEKLSAQAPSSPDSQTATR